MNRPTFNRFAEGDPREDFNRRMRIYLVHLEENQMPDHYRAVILDRDMAIQEAVRDALENRALKKTLKTLRSEIKNIYKEHHGYQEKTVHSLQDSYDRSKS